jgi:hypothetical protein
MRTFGEYPFLAALAAILLLAPPASLAAGSGKNSSPAKVVKKYSGKNAERKKLERKGVLGWVSRKRQMRRLHSQMRKELGELTTIADGAQVKTIYLARTARGMLSYNVKKKQLFFKESFQEKPAETVLYPEELEDLLRQAHEAAKSLRSDEATALLNRSEPILNLSSPATIRNSAIINRLRGRLATAKAKRVLIARLAVERNKHRTFDDEYLLAATRGGELKIVKRNGRSVDELSSSARLDALSAAELDAILTRAHRAVRTGSLELSEEGALRNGQIVDLVDGAESLADLVELRENEPLRGDTGVVRTMQRKTLVRTSRQGQGPGGRVEKRRRRSRLNKEIAGELGELRLIASELKLNEVALAETSKGPLVFDLKSQEVLLNRKPADTVLSNAKIKNLVRKAHEALTSKSTSSQTLALLKAKRSLLNYRNLTQRRHAAKINKLRLGVLTNAGKWVILARVAAGKPRPRSDRYESVLVMDTAGELAVVKRWGNILFLASGAEPDSLGALTDSDDGRAVLADVLERATEIADKNPIAFADATSRKRAHLIDLVGNPGKYGKTIEEVIEAHAATLSQR